MFEILLLFLITLIYSKKVTLTVFHVKDWDKNENLNKKRVYML